MRSRPLTTVVSVLVVALVGALAAVYAYDSSRGKTIAKGVTIGGVALGGLSPDVARAKLERSYLTGLKRTIVVHHATYSWPLGAREARITANVSAMVDDAVARGDKGTMFSRSWRRLTGGRVDAALQPEVTFSDAAVVRLLDKVRGSVNRAPKDASLKFSALGFSKVGSRTGLSLDASRLHREIREAIVSPSADRTFVAHTKKVAPKVSSDALATRYATVVIIDRADFRLRLFKNLKAARSYPIAVGQVGLETPAGLYTIQNKAVDPAWHVPNSAWAGSLAGTVIPGGAPNNPIKARWLGVYDGVGVHGTSDDASIGSNASHGCIRMHIPDVEALYDQVPVGTPIYIA